MNNHHQESSRSIYVRKNVSKILGENKIDFLFIDGDHSYNGVKSDFINYEQYVSDNGIIAFHDIVNNPADLSIEVPRFWREIKKKYDYSELIENINQTSMGIGIIYKNKQLKNI